MNTQAKMKVGTLTGVSIVVANMVGTGAFTSLGFQLESLSNVYTILSLWIVGGLVALCGAFSYAEIGTDIRKSGGEYTFLSELFHPLAGYLSGWISLTVGFAAPIALAAMAFAQYLPFDVKYPKLIGIFLVIVITFIHCQNLNNSSKFQNISTLIKIVLVVIFISIGFILPNDGENAINIEKSYWLEIGSAAFAINLVYVSYSYSGWNAAAYITDEFKDPRKSLPVALIGGTLIVTILYTLLQYVMLKHAPFAELAGKLNVGTISIEHMLGNSSAKIFGGAISLLLLSGISAMIWVGARVTSSIARDHALWKYFKAKENSVPTKALWLQAILSSFLILSGTFEQVMMYCGVLLNIPTLLVVLGVIIKRYKQQKELNPVSENFKSPLFPVLQIIFILISVWMIYFAISNNVMATIIGIINLIVGLVTYFISKKMEAPH